jgi:hypothetical protein
MSVQMGAKLVKEKGRMLVQEKGRMLVPEMVQVKEQGMDLCSSIKKLL